MNNPKTPDFSSLDQWCKDLPIRHDPPNTVEAMNNYGLVMLKVQDGVTRCFVETMQRLEFAEQRDDEQLTQDIGDVVASLRTLMSFTQAKIEWFGLKTKDTQ